MNNLPYPKLKNCRTGALIDINSSPFTIGRGVSCNYVLLSKAVSRVHCVVEICDNAWILRDTSTNGTLINGQLIRKDKSGPLKNDDLISFEPDHLDSFIFQINESSNEGITDEQLCAIADSVLNGVEFLNDQDFLAASNQARLGVLDPLHDHIYVASSPEQVIKKARVTRSTRSTRANLSQEVLPTVSTSGTTMRRKINVTSDNSVIVSVDSGATTSRVSDVVLVENGDMPYNLRSSGRSEETLKPSLPDPDRGGEILVQPGPSTENLENNPTSLTSTGSDNKVAQTGSYEEMENELQCAICSELFIKAVTLNCSHTFCKYCIGTWTKGKNDCPICRAKITSTNATIVLDNVIDKVIESSSEEIKKHRESILEERRKLEEAVNAAAASNSTRQTRARGGDRGRTGRRSRGVRSNRSANHQGDVPRINILDPLSINIGALVNNSVIELSSDSEWSTDTESTSPDDLGLDYDDAYDYPEWYNLGRPYWGGYGNCFRCGSPNHWANGCPNR